MCEELEKETENTFGFRVNNEERVKVVKVIHSSEEDIPTGSQIKVMSTAGLVDNGTLILRRSDVIYIL